LPSAIAEVRRPVLPASDKEWPDDKARSSPRLDARHLHSPKYSIRCDDDTRPRREMRPTSRSAASVQTQAHRDKIQARVPSSPLSNAHDPSGHWDELLSSPRGNVASSMPFRQMLSTWRNSHLCARSVKS